MHFSEERAHQDVDILVQDILSFVAKERSMELEHSKMTPKFLVKPDTDNLTFSSAYILLSFRASSMSLVAGLLLHGCSILSAFYQKPLSHN